MHRSIQKTAVKHQRYSSLRATDILSHCILACTLARQLSKVLHGLTPYKLAMQDLDQEHWQIYT
jgi:hypothetical protein